MKLPTRIAAAVLTVTAACALPAAALAECRPLADGNYTPSRQKALENISVCDFYAPDVSVNTKTHAINNLYDDKGNLIPATLSSDGHWFIVPTQEGYLYIGTGH